MQKLESLFELQIPSPLQAFDIPDLNSSELKVYAKRDDLIHPEISGNKFRKLKHNFEAFRLGKYKEIVAFGGAFSNLLYTLSFITKKASIPATFYVRGDGFDPNNPTLNTLKKNGASLVFLDRSTYRMKNDDAFLRDLHERHPGAFFIPEGGSNSLALPGAAEIIKELKMQLGKDPDYLLMDIGSGGTFTGVLRELSSNTTLIGIPVLKGVNWNRTISRLLNKEVDLAQIPNVSIAEDYHFGGFAKYNEKLIDFINFFTSKYSIQADPIYTAKLLYALFDLVKSGHFKKGSSLVWVHGGGNQGIDGFNYLNGKLIH